MRALFQGFLITAIFAASLFARSNQPPQSGMGTSDQRSAAANEKLQERLYKEVGHQLRMMALFDTFDNLAYKIDGTTVTLLGQIVHATLKDEAEQRVKKIEGVEQVVNNIEILPPSGNDDRLRRQLAHAIFRDSRLSHYAVGAVPPIHIIVRSGHVFLEGVVRNKGEKNAAGLRANGVAGVFSVENNLRVENDEKR